MVFNPGKRRARRLDAAEGYLNLEMPDQALKELASITDLGDAEFAWHILRAEALRSKREHEEALLSFQTAHELQPDDLTALLGMAWCYKRIGRVDQSIEMMRLAHQAHPDIPLVVYNLACYYSLARDKDQALSWLGRAIRMDQGYGKLIADESDFDPIRDDADFKHLLELSIKR